MLSSAKEIKRGAVLSAINTLLGILSTIIITPFILENLGQEDYGLYSLVNAIITGISLLNFGLGASLTRFIARYRAQNDKESEEKIYGLCLILFIGIAILAAILGIVFIRYIPNFKSVLNGQTVKSRLMLGMMCISMVVTLASQVFPAALSAYEKFTMMRGWELFRNVINPLLKLFIISVYGIDALIIVLIDVIFNIVYQIVIIFYARINIKVRFRFTGIPRSMLTDLFSYSFFIFLATLVDILYWRTDTFILAVFSNNQEISIANLGGQFADYFTRIATILSTLLMTRVMVMVIRNASGKELTDAMIKLGRVQMIILGLILIGYILCGRHFVNQWARGNFYHAKIYYMGLMLMLAQFVPLTQVLGLSILQAKNMHRFRSVTYLIIAIINIIISIPLSIKFGAMGATAGTVIALIMGQLITMNLYYRYKVGLEMGRYFKETFKGLLPGMLLALALGCVTFLLPQEGQDWLLLRMFVVMVIYIAVQWFIGINKYEKSLAIKAFKSSKLRSVIANKRVKRP
ncbi:MAG: polysaccharide biosynthesis C-terminal domain-containing protein [Oscillospiraceae bacterium]|jgi:O-antigen/teichoic acid export membrane protein|nr:polysaccharide biosynthesis C-terminal domain-containing protein [Oscillospiraceae bacterium]